MIKDWIAEYKPQNEDETLAALREIMQEITLAGLSRTDFFEQAAFYGGTALRIFYGLDRFSEDLDFYLPNDKRKVEILFENLKKNFLLFNLKIFYNIFGNTKKEFI